MNVPLAALGADADNDDAACEPVGSVEETVSIPISCSG